MKKIFGIWLTLTLFAYTLFTPIYLFSNSSVDEIEELTFKDLFITVNLQNYPSSWKDQENRLDRIAEKLDIDTDIELLEVLEDSENISNINVRVAKSIRSAVDQKDDLVELSFQSKKLGDVQLFFWVKDKTFLFPSLSAFLAPRNAIINGESMPLDDDELIYNLYYRI